MTWLVNGCSFTYGDELENHEEERWSNHLSKLLNEKIINIALPGSSNKQIWRRTMERLHNEEFTNCFILWSAFERIETIEFNAGVTIKSDDGVALSNIHPDYYVQWSPARLDTTPWRYKKDEFENFYSRIYSSETGIMDTAFYMYDLYNICKLKNINYYQGFFHQGNKFVIERTFSENRLINYGTRLERVINSWNNLIKEFTGNQRIGFDERSLSFNEFTEINNYNKMPEGHPGPEAHEGYAKYLYDNFIVR